MGNAACGIEINESFVAKVLGHVNRQKPEWFNYGTSYFIGHPSECPKPLPSGQFITAQNEMGLPGGNYLHYVLQVVQAALDLYPNTVSGCPPEICPEPQHAVAVVGVKFGSRIVNANTGTHSDLQQFDLQVWLKLAFENVVECGVPDQRSGPPIEKLYLVAESLEIVDIMPKGLEDTLERIAVIVLNEGYLKKVKIPLETRMKIPTGPDSYVFLHAFRHHNAAANPSIDENKIRYLIDTEITPSTSRGHSYGI